RFTTRGARASFIGCPRRRRPPAPGPRTSRPGRRPWTRCSRAPTSPPRPAAWPSCSPARCWRRAGTMSEQSPSGAGAPAEPWVEVAGSPRLPAWLGEHRVSLAFTTYKTGKLFLLGRGPEGRLAVVERSFNRAMGLWADAQSLWLGTRFQIWRIENLLRP